MQLHIGGSLESNMIKLPRVVLCCAFWALIAPTFIFTANSEVTPESLIEGLEGAQYLINDNGALLAVEEINKRIEDLQNEMEKLASLSETVSGDEDAIVRLVNLANAKQVESLISRLNETLSKEVALRHAAETLLPKKEDGDSEDEGMKHAEKTEDDIEYVDVKQLKQAFDVRRLLAGSENELIEWALTIVKDELGAYKKEKLKTVSDRNKAGTGMSSGSCPQIQDVVQQVQTALTRYSQDSIGLTDHAQGGEIVHKMTSSTYQPPPTEQELLGNVWWRKFIPEDWESLLPDGWEYWNVGIPQLVYHSLSLTGAKASPPEAILQKKTSPGSCWPMNGSKGQVTIRLAYPIKVDSFSIDHASSNILPEGMRETAPKRMKVIAYPPCTEPEECGALGFDVYDPMEIAHFSFDIEGTSIQTFDSVFVSPDSSEVEGDDEDLLLDGLVADEEKSSSCSQEAAACSSPPRIDVAAITLKVLENHGNPDYTCIYRVRVHGEQV